MSSDNRQVRKNLTFNILALVANVVVGIFYTPYLVKSLGIIAYGILPLALIVNQYVSVITGSLTSALTRFYSIALQKGDKEEASKSLSTSFLIIIVLVIIFAFPLWYLIQNIDMVFTIPEEFVTDAKLLFIYTTLSFFISLFSSVFNITLYAFNRLDLLNVVKIIRVTGKWIFVMLLFTGLDINVAYVGLSSLITELILLIFSVSVFSRFSIGKVNFSLSKFDNTVFKAIGFMGLWTMIHQLGDTAIYRIDNILVNVFWSSKESGILGAFTELGNYTFIVSSVIGSLFGPLILIAYANDRHEDVKQMTLDRSLTVGVLVAVMTGVLAGFSPTILKIWLGQEFVEYNLWLILKLLLIPFYASAGVFSFGIRAWNKVRFPALMTVLLGFVNFLFLYLIASNASDDLSYINWMLIVGLIFGVCQSYLLSGLYFAAIYKGTWRHIIINFVKISILVLIISSISTILNPYIAVYNNTISLTFIVLFGLIILFISLKVLLNERQWLALKHLIYKK